MTIYNQIQKWTMIVVYLVYIKYWKHKFHEFKPKEWILRQRRKINPFKFPVIEGGAAYFKVWALVQSWPIIWWFKVDNCFPIMSYSGLVFYVISSLTPLLFIEVSVPRQESEGMCIYALGTSSCWQSMQLLSMNMHKRAMMSFPRSLQVINQHIIGQLWTNI
jgi:hypothetical protein